MKRNHDKGFTLIELISAIAILSIVGISAFTLLMFSIRSNNVIVTGTSAAQDADLLNKRLEILFEDTKVVLMPEDKSENETWQRIKLVPMQDEESEAYLEVVGNALQYSFPPAKPEIYQDNLSFFEIRLIPDTNLLRISYSIGDREFTKLFRVNLAASENPT